MRRKCGVNIAKAWVTWVAYGMGHTMWILFEPDYVMPLGFVWGIRGKGKKLSRFDVLGSYVIKWARRTGVRNRINEEILKQYDMVTTLSGSQSGAPFMRATGYKYVKEMDMWFKKRAK